MIVIHGQKRVLNWRPSRPDANRRVWAANRVSLSPPSLDPLDTQVAIWDQGQLGSCTAHGNGRIFAYRIWKELSKVFMPSRLFIYYCERMQEGTVKQDAGAIIHDGLAALEQYGCPPEKLWKYDIRKFATKPPASVWRNALKELALQGASVPLDVDSIKASLMADLPVTFGFTVFESFMNNAWLSGGIMPLPIAGEKTVGGHCVVFVGWDDSKSAFWCSNSWGSNWGINGRFLMPYAFLSNCGDAVNLSKV